MVQGMAELVQRSNNTGETANYPITMSPFSEKNQNNKTTSEISPEIVSAEVSNDESVSIDSSSSSSEDERQSNESVRPVVCRSQDDSSDEFKVSISKTTEPYNVPSVVIPRTVPCIVLTPPVPFNPGLPLAHNFTSALGGRAVSENSHIMSPLIENPFLYGSSRHSSIFSGTKGDTKGEKSLNLTFGKKGEKHAGECKDPAPKKLAFGIDRILSEENEDAGLNLMMKPKPRHGHPIEFNLKSYHNNHSEDHHHNHQHHPAAGPASDSYASQCTECFFLARYCRRIQFPLTSTAAVASPFSWIPSPAAGHPTESSSSSILPPNGYGQPHHIPYGLSSSNFTNMSPMVSCNTSGNGRRKRSWSRAVFSNLQRKGLEKRFQLQKYITKPDRRQLAATLGLTDAQVKVWFQNRRMKWRHSKEGKQGTHVASSEDTKTTLTSEKK